MTLGKLLFSTASDMLHYVKPSNFFSKTEAKFANYPICRQRELSTFRRSSVYLLTRDKPDVSFLVNVLASDRGVLPEAMLDPSTYATTAW
ncbi:hypothetical protein AGR6A_pTi0012 [Agrobacterium sp. NCPPB 925]|uniref:Uncharacterized protein n=1 Tax=Agrobacterium genomosp. 6 TaxID=1183411 RepID=A0A2Z2PGA4_9HYPH|nr:hypothetical protein [Agrobacterium genomosp. 6]ASK41340.1 hypothetical protein [Agrobacterium genomosp. 6]CUX71212.1 hypothetical protein AGR6A_pTi0012 [Agrobacterium sp. NCPPB 925]